MTKNIILLGALTLSTLAYSQVGINNEAPKATLDVTAKLTTPETAEGIIAPRLSGNEIKGKDAQYLTEQTGTIVYATSASSDAGVATTKTINITGAGYYYFDGAIWQKFNSGATTTGTEPWYNQADGTPATANTQNIYQTGKVSIGENPATSDATLNVYNNDTSSASIRTYGIKNVMSSNSSENKYGIYNSLTAVEGSSGDFIYGLNNLVNDNSAMPLFYGSYNRFNVNGNKANAGIYGNYNETRVVPTNGATTFNQVQGSAFHASIGGNTTGGSARGNYTTLTTYPVAGTTTSLSSSHGAYIGTIIGGQGATNITNAHGITSVFRKEGGSTYTGTKVSALTSSTELTAGIGTYTIGSLFGIEVARTGTGTGTGTIANSYGVYIGRYRFPGDTPANAYNVYSEGADTKNYFQGKVGIGAGATAPASNLKVTGLQNLADNAVALSAGLAVGDFYHTDGVVKVVY